MGQRMFAIANLVPPPHARSRSHVALAGHRKTPAADKSCCESHRNLTPPPECLRMHRPPITASRLQSGPDLAEAATDTGPGNRKNLHPEGTGSNEPLW